jgi:Zn-dependent protease with chaperone function
MADPFWAHLASNWKPVPKRPGYVIGLGIMGLVILSIPLVYLALVALIGWGVWLHLANDAGIFEHVRGRGALGALAIYLAPAVAGIALIVMMLKPIFAPAARKGGSVELKQFEELKLHSFVENVCAIVGAPAPKTISIDCDINASAGFRSAWSMLRRSDMELTIGLPLVAGMSKRQFAGVLAHEFGHFAQGAGMRVTYIVRRMIDWMARAAFQRDAWDAWLDDAGSSSGAWGALIVLFCKLCIFVGRLIMMVLAYAVLALCSFMLRQMEFDADRYEVQFGGSGCFESTSLRMGELAAARSRAFGECSTSYKRARELPDNLPALIGAIARRLSPEDRAEVAGALAKEKLGLFASHPSTKARVAAAKTLGEPGLYTDEAPARELFGDFETACKKATIGHYQGFLGPHFVGTKLRPSSAMIEVGEKDAAREATLPRYLGYEPPTWRPVFVPLARVPDVDEPKAILERLRRARAALKDKAAAARIKVEEYRKAAEESAKWEQARTALDAGLVINFERLGLKSTSRMGVSTKIELLGTQAADAAGVIDEAGEIAMARLAAGLSLLGARSIDRHIPGASAMRPRADALLRAMGALRETLPMARAVRQAVACTRVAGSTVKNQKTLDAAKKLVRPQTDEIRNRLDDARRIAGGTPDPYAKVEQAAAYATQSEAANLGETLVGATPAWRELDEIIGAGDLFVGRWSDMYRRVLGELVEMGDRIEKSLSAPRPAAGAPVGAEASA